MKLYIDDLDIEDDDPMFEVNWPAEFRVPVAGEVLCIGIGRWIVHDVQWDIEQGDLPSSVTLRVAAPPRIAFAGPDAS